MPVIRGTIEIGRPVEEVFAYVTEPKNTQEWVSGVEVDNLTSKGPIGVGSKGRRVETYMGRDELVWEVTEWTLNELAAFEVESDKFIGHGEYRTEPADGATRLTYRFKGDAKTPFFILFMPFMMPMFNRKAKKDYRKLKAILESRS